MGYLIPNDFKKLIQVDNLNSIINNDPTILDGAIDDASAVAKERLVQKYIISQELADINSYDVAAIYKAGQRVYLNPSSFDQSNVYSVGSLAIYNGDVYKCVTLTTINTAFNPAQWTILGPQYQIYFIAYPQPPFVLNKFYNVGDKVFYLDKVYTALKSTVVLNHETMIQFQNYASLPYTNVFPDDPSQGALYWGTGVAFSVAAGQLPTGWTKGDNRNRSLVRHCLAIALWIIHDRISPNNIPALREKRYIAALKWLTDAAEGNITAELPLIQPRSGGRVRYGGNIKNVNNY